MGALSASPPTTSDLGSAFHQAGPGTGNFRSCVSYRRLRRQLRSTRGPGSPSSPAAPGTRSRILKHPGKAQPSLGGRAALPLPWEAITLWHSTGSSPKVESLQLTDPEERPSSPPPQSGALARFADTADEPTLSEPEKAHKHWPRPGAFSLLCIWRTSPGSGGAWSRRGVEPLFAATCEPPGPGRAHRSLRLSDSRPRLPASCGVSKNAKGECGISPGWP
uniref:Uncharacterized protein n=1 Tax=Rangifer tarandus platyrhynchus TaxID=3082113 RepID=A0ACB0DYZ7_RANTA|nr:unnamed protein product [Rangifer tarandus platyrhynchus]